jgi:superfamily I DNA and/or RNA helicase
MTQKNVKIIIKGVDKTKDITTWSEVDNKISVAYSNGKTYFYNKENIQIEHSALSNDNALNCFNYLKNIAKIVGVIGKSNDNILLSQYEKIKFLSKETILASFLTGSLKNTVKKALPPIIIYPFGFNLSQKTAIDNAMQNSLSIIEGPPGTGKTQTILNIIANALVNKESIAIVSSNNSATTNIFDKLKKYKLNFIVANLGSLENKQNFIESQATLPNLSSWEITIDQEKQIKESLQNLYSTLSKMLSNQNKLSELKQELASIELEYKHFNTYCNYQEEVIYSYLKHSTSDIALELWFKCEKYIKNNKIPNFFTRLVNRFYKGVISKSFYLLQHEKMINICQKNYYIIKIKELSLLISDLQAILNNFNFNKKMQEYSSLSMKIFHHELAKKYRDIKNKEFIIEDLRNNSKGFIKRYPVILSTTYSLRNSLSNDTIYDYVIIDEASQVNLSTGSLALSCAKKAVIVGDLKQLPNVVTKEEEKDTDRIFESYKLPEFYRYKNNSILSSILGLFPNADKVLLKEHYRCHPKIIDFCNKKFYNNELIILTEPKSNLQPLVVYKTVAGNHARKNVNQRQIDIIQQEIFPQQQLNKNNISIGIVTPYRKQTNALQKTFQGTEIEADTVDKFQGRENDIIILSTVDNEISEFTDNPNRLNVAVSRAIDQLIVVLNGNEETKDTNIKDLVNYIKYNNLEIIQSEVYSVFDYLYKGYSAKKETFLQKKKISSYDSENLMHALICSVLNKDKFMKFDVISHVSLKTILKNTDKLEQDEKKYAENMLTHVDFLIFNKLGKIPMLAIEVDGVSYHAENTAQAQRDKLKNSILKKYKLPLIRFKTNGSGEYELLVSKLNELMNNN